MHHYVMRQSRLAYIVTSPAGAVAKIAMSMSVCVCVCVCVHVHEHIPGTT